MKAEEIFDVRGMCAAVTGGASGLGFAYARALCDNGAKVTIFDYAPEALDRAVAELEERGGAARGVALDVTDRAAVTAAIDATAAHCGRLDIVFANAGIKAGPGFLSITGERTRDGAIEEIPEELWDKVIATNLGGIFATVRAAAAHMKAQGSGRIIVTTSIAGIRPSAIVGPPYMIAKAGAAHLMRQAALELAPFGVRVNAIAPGPFQTGFSTPEMDSAFTATSPMHRVATTEEVEGLALFLASNASSFVTGAEYVIDGGSLLGRAD